MVYSEEQRRERNEELEEEEEEEEAAISMAREEEEEEVERVKPKPKPPLYNFNQPFLLKWGHQKQLRCVKLDHHHHNNTSTGFYSSGDRSHCRRGRCTIKNHRSSSSSSPGVRIHDFRQEFKIPRQRVVVTAAAAAAAVDDEVEEGIDAVREKLVFDLKKEADMMKHAIFKNDVSDDDDEVVVEHDDERFRPLVVGVAATGSTEQEAARPWNLRTRRTAGKASPASNGPPAVNEGVKVTRTRVGREAHKEERAKFSVGLMRKEIEDDFMAMVGHRAPRRPKKRPRNVQKELDVSSADG